MKTPEDEAFEDIERRQGGFQAKRQMAADKMQDETDMLTIAYLDGYEMGKKEALAQPAQEPVKHWSDCAVHNEPAYPAGPCDCGVEEEPAQEPFGWWVETHSTASNRFFRNKQVAFEYWKTDPDGDWYIDKLYTAPPQREWVGLTDDEIKTIVANYCLTVGNWSLNGLSVAQAVAAKLKEKNNGT